MKKLGIIALIAGIAALLYKLFSNLSVPKVGTASTAVAASTSPTVVNTQLSVPTVYNGFSRAESTVAGSIAAGKNFIKISNIGDSTGAINVGNGNTNLAAGQSWQFPIVLGNAQMLSTAISFDATGTTFLIETSTPV